MRIDIPSDFFCDEKLIPTVHYGGATAAISPQKSVSVSEVSEKSRSRHGSIGVSSSSSSGESADEKEIDALFCSVRGGQWHESSGARDSSSDASSDSDQNFNNFAAASTKTSPVADEGEDGDDGVWRWTLERSATVGEGGLDMVPIDADAPTGNDREGPIPAISRRKVKVCRRLY